MPKDAFVLRHVHFEDLGTFGPVLAEAGYGVRYLDIGVDDPRAFDPVEADLVVVLGGPIGAYETEAYPFLAGEIHLIEARLAAGRPTFGICLGAQLMAVALGAAVRPTGTKEIGFSPLFLTTEGEAGPLRHLRGASVLHWHGDMFDIPRDAVRLAGTPPCANQAFSLGPNVMGVQFHPEADVASGFERWLVGHACELAGAGIDPRALREGAARHGAALRDAGRAMFAEWLQGLRW